jgi:TRAP-type C4-dicarboxylate transport system substrate-binding protein
MRRHDEDLRADAAAIPAPSGAAGRRLVAALLATGLALLAACGGDESRRAEILLRYGSPYTPMHPFSRADLAWIAYVEERTGGRVHVEPYWSGSLLTAAESIIEIRHGVADIGLITPIYARGDAHMIRTQSGFYAGARTVAQQVDVYRCLAAAEPQFGREMDGLVVLAVQGGSLPGIVTRDRPVRHLGDLRGMRIRAPTELLSVLRELGADPVNMPMGEVYSAMAKGVLDGVVAPADTLRALHFAEIARYFTTLEVPRGAYPARAMGAERWARLPEDVRAVLRDGTRVWEEALDREVTQALQQGIDFGREAGVEFIDVPAEDQRRFDEIYTAEGLRNARALQSFGLDGEPVFRRAQALAAAIGADGRVHCEAGGT